MLTRGSMLELTLSPGSIALGIDNDKSFGSFFTLRTFIISILPYVIVVVFTYIMHMQFSKLLLMNFSRVSLEPNV